jgi:hypothetical protein
MLLAGALLARAQVQALWRGAASGVTANRMA